MHLPAKDAAGLFQQPAALVALILLECFEGKDGSANSKAGGRAWSPRIARLIGLICKCANDYRLTRPDAILTRARANSHPGFGLSVCGACIEAAGTPFLSACANSRVSRAKTHFSAWLSADNRTFLLLSSTSVAGVSSPRFSC